MFESLFIDYNNEGDVSLLIVIGGPVSFALSCIGAAYGRWFLRAMMGRR